MYIHCIYTVHVQVYNHIHYTHICLHIRAYVGLPLLIPDENTSLEKNGIGRGSEGTPIRSGGSNLTCSSCIDLHNRPEIEIYIYIP